jgi:hypothetical protein
MDFDKFRAAPCDHIESLIKMIVYLTPPKSSTRLIKSDDADRHDEIRIHIPDGRTFAIRIQMNGSMDLVKITTTDTNDEVAEPIANWSPNAFYPDIDRYFRAIATRLFSNIGKVSPHENR